MTLELHRWFERMAEKVGPFTSCEGMKLVAISEHVARAEGRREACARIQYPEEWLDLPDRRTGGD